MEGLLLFHIPKCFCVSVDIRVDLLGWPASTFVLGFVAVDSQHSDNNTSHHDSQDPRHQAGHIHSACRRFKEKISLTPNLLTHLHTAPDYKVQPKLKDLRYSKWAKTHSKIVLEHSADIKEHMWGFGDKIWECTFNQAEIVKKKFAYRNYNIIMLTIIIK